MFDLEKFTVTPAAQRRMDEHGITLDEILHTVQRSRRDDVVDDFDVAWVIAFREEASRRRAGLAHLRETGAQRDQAQAPVRRPHIDLNLDWANLPPEIRAQLGG